MPNLTEGTTIGDIVRREVLGDSNFCREVLSIKASVAVSKGDVLHPDGSDHDILNIAGDGAAADAIALADVGASDADRSCLCLVRGPAIVRKDELNYGSGTEADADAALTALGILPRS